MKNQLFIAILAAMLIAAQAAAQTNNKYGYPPKIVGDYAAYVRSVQADSNQSLREIAKYVPGVVLDIRYATDNNFLKKRFYTQAKAFARRPVAEALRKVQAELKDKGLGLKIYDAYRPYAVTVQFYQSFPDSTYVASPWSGSKHNRGCALDMTLIELATGKELEMPTPYDSSIKESWADAPVKNPAALQNRETLKAVMSKYGFTVEPSEWWHYNFIGWQGYDLMDISFESLTDRTGYTRQEIKIPVRDGVKLNTVIWTPRDAKEPLPFLLIRTPYGVSENPAPDVQTLTRYLSSAGYIFVEQDIRGKYQSEGTFEMTRASIDADNKKTVDESTDTYDTVDWLLKNIPNNNGKVGVTGVSYPGWLSMMAAVNPHPAIKAISEQAMMGDLFINDDFHHNGAFRLSYGFDYSFELETTKTDSLFPFHSYDNFNWYLRLGSLANVNEKYFHHKIPSWENFVNHPNYDAFWQKLSPINRFKNYKQTIPIQHVAGWFDQEDMNGPLLMYDLLEKNNPANLNFMVIGPWNHGGWAAKDGSTLGELNFELPASKNFQEDVMTPFFNYYLKGLGDGKFPKATIFQTGSNRWIKYDQWKPNEAKKRSIYFQAKGKLSFDAPVTAASKSYDAYMSDPARPVPYRQRPIEQTYGPGSRWRPWLTEDQRFVDGRPDVLTWQTDTLTSDVAIAGAINARLFASTTATDADWVVKLIDVYPDEYENDLKMSGYEQMVARDVLRGRFRNSLENPQSVKPNKIVAYNVNLLQADHVFKKGHKIMVQVQSTWFPMIDRNPQNYVPNIFMAKESDFIKAEHRVYRTTEYPSHIELPVVEN